MSYANEKGAKGEKQFAEFLNKFMGQFGFKFIRLGGTERSKKIFCGDVMLDPRSDPKKNCVLSDYFLEVKKRARPLPFEVMRESEENAVSAGKRGAIAYITKQIRGNVGMAGETIVVMKPKTFQALLEELQGYRHQDES